MTIIFSWLIFSLIVGAIGSKRRIGFWSAFLISLLLSPLIGLILALVSRDIEVASYEAQMMDTQQQQAEALRNMQFQSTAAGQKSIVDQLEKLSQLKEAGHLTDEEYAQAKIKIITSAV